jgi:hypothetical protein
LSAPLQLRARGIYTANVGVRLANLPEGLRFCEPFDRIDLVVARGTSVLIDPWTARNPQQIEAKIGASPTVFPVGSLASVSSAVDATISLVDAPGLISGPKLGQLDFWRDVVPDDRLKSDH